MIHMAHFASRRTLLPLLSRYGVLPRYWQTWAQAPAWLKRMWEVAGRQCPTPKKRDTQCWSWAHQPKATSRKRGRKTLSEKAAIRAAVEDKFQ